MEFLDRDMTSGQDKYERLKQEEEGEEEGEEEKDEDEEVHYDGETQLHEPDEDVVDLTRKQTRYCNGVCIAMKLLYYNNRKVNTPFCDGRAHPRLLAIKGQLKNEQAIGEYR